MNYLQALRLGPPHPFTPKRRLSSGRGVVSCFRRGNRLIVAFPFSLIGLVLSIVALVQSTRAGYANTPAVIGIIVGAVLLVGWIILLGILITVFGNLFAQCAELGSGTHYVNGVTYTCS